MASLLNVINDFPEHQKGSFVTELHSEIIRNVINSNNILDMTALDPTESQKTVADNK